MTQTIETVKRTASISREDALKGLLTRFPGFDIVSFVQEGNEYVAQIKKQGFDEAGFEGPAAGGIPPEESESSDDGVEEKDDGDVTVKVEGDDDKGEEGGSEKDMLHELLALVKEMVMGPGEGAPLGEEGPTGPPEAIPGDPGIDPELPSQVKPSNSMEGMQAAPTRAFAHMTDKRTYFVEADAPGQSLKAAVAELNAAVGPTHRVAKIKRQGTKIVAAVTKVA